MKLFQKLIAAPAIISMASGFAVNAAEINSTDLSDYSNSNNLVSLGDFKSDTLFPGDWAYDSLKDLTNSPKFNGNSVTRLEAAAELNNLIAGGEGLMNGAAINRLSDELGSELAIMKGRVDGLEARLNTIEAGSFSETTTASFKAIFGLGAVDGQGVTSTVTDGNEDLEFAYSFQTKLKTSFTGDDSLSIAIDSGSATKNSVHALDEIAGMDETSDVLKVDGIGYKFPLGDNITVLVGDGLDASKQFTFACAYGGPTDTLDDCGAPNAAVDEGGAHLSFEYDFGNGFTTAFGYAGDESSLGTKGGQDGYGLNAAYSADKYGVSLTYGVVEDGNDNDTFTALNGYYSFDNGLNISAGYEIGDLDGAAAAQDETEAYFVGVNGEVGPGELGAAVGTYGYMTESGGTMPERMMYEAYYSYAVNDGMTITPLIYTVEADGSTDKDETGIMVKTSFSF